MKSTNVQDLSFELLKERLQSVVDRLDQAGFSIIFYILYLVFFTLLILYVIWILARQQSQ